MRNFLWLILTLCAFNTFCQDTLADTFAPIPRDTLKRLEIAYCFTGINANSELPLSNRNAVTFEILNSILLRYKINRLSLRLNASFIKRNYYKDCPINCSNYTYGQSKAEDYKLGAGLQYTPLKIKEYFYSFIDISYKKRDEVGSIVNYTNNVAVFDNYHAKKNGVDFTTGFGSKIKVFKNIFFSNEIGYNYFIAQSKKRSTDINTGQITNSISPYYFQTFTFKFYLSVVF